jgi:hypothetical protein
MRDGIVNVNLEDSVALSNKPLQRLNACAARSGVGRAATPRAGARGSSRPWYDRATVRRSPLNGRSLDGQMSWWVGVAILGVALALWNARVTVRVWRSGVYERGQLVAQTAIIWLVPGSAIVVAAVLKGGAPHRADDPTAPNPDTPNATITTGASGVGAP